MLRLLAEIVIIGLFQTITTSEKTIVEVSEVPNLQFLNDHYKVHFLFVHKKPDGECQEF